MAAVVTVIGGILRLHPAGREKTDHGYGWLLLFVVEG